MPVVGNDKGIVPALNLLDWDVVDRNETGCPWDEAKFEVGHSGPRVVIGELPLTIGL